MFYDQLNALGKLGNLLCDASACKTGRSHHPHATNYLDIVKYSSEARESWAFAVFNAGDDAAVRRFISYEMTLLDDCLQKCFKENPAIGIASELVKLSQHLYDHYRHYLVPETKLPVLLVSTIISKLAETMILIESAATSRVEDESLRTIIIYQIEEIRSLSYKTCCLAGELIYSEIFVQALEQIIQNDAGSSTTEIITEKLIEINFNNIQFFLYLEDQTRQLLLGRTPPDQLTELRRQKQKYDYLSPDGAYSHKWKPIGEMMSNWITEEIVLISAASHGEESASASIQETLGFNLSVAQLACLTKVFSKAGVYLSNITSVLNWSARYFHSKQQPHISEISFSKEYYSVSQRTAAQVLELLQKMCTIIKNDYFPLIVAISTAHLLK